MNPAAKDVDAYIELQPENVRAVLTELRHEIKKTVPEAEELISYQMPAFRFHGMLVWYAAFKHHYSIFIPRNILNVFHEELNPFELTKSKSAIKILPASPCLLNLFQKLSNTGQKQTWKRNNQKPKEENRIITVVVHDCQ